MPITYLMCSVAGLLDIVLNPLVIVTVIIAELGLIVTSVGNVFWDRNTNGLCCDVLASCERVRQAWYWQATSPEQCSPNKPRHSAGELCKKGINLLLGICLTGLC